MEKTLFCIVNALGYNAIFAVFVLVAYALRSARPWLKWIVYFVGLFLQVDIEYSQAYGNLQSAWGKDMFSYYAAVTAVIAILGFLLIRRPVRKKDQVDGSTVRGMPLQNTDSSSVPVLNNDEYHHDNTIHLTSHETEHHLLPADTELPEDAESVGTTMDNSKNNSHAIIEALDNSFYKTVNNYALADGSAEFYAPVYQPEEFCDSAYLYCRKQYGTDDKKKLVFEYCMTSFYGAICTVALLKEDIKQFENGKAWDVLYKQINVEFTDANADRFMKTKQGEEKSDAVFHIISDYFNSVYPIINSCALEESVCKHAMQLAYKLGMMVAGKEFFISDCPTVKEELSHREDKDDKEVPVILKAPDDFYKDCLSSFHQFASEKGYVKNGIIFIPELMPIGERIVKAFLTDPFFISEYASDPLQYYYAIVGLSIQAGMVIADKWHTNYSELKNGFVDTVISEGPAEMAQALMDANFHVNAEKANEFYSGIYTIWMQLHNPYWVVNDPRKYTFLGTVAAYQVGISTILGQYGF